MIPEQRVLKLIPALYDAAVHEEGVENALDAIAGSLDGYQVELALEAPGGGLAPVIYSSDANHEHVAAYAEYFHAIDPGFAQMGSARVGKVVPFESFISAAEILRSEFYHDFLLPCGLSWGPNFSAVLAREEERPAAFMAIANRRGAAPLDAEGVELLELLIPHLIMMRSTWATLQEVSSRETQLADAFDLLPTAVFIVDARHRVIWANRSARVLVGDRDGLCIERGRLRAETRSVSRRLEMLLGAAAGTGDGRGLSAGGTLLAPRASGGRPLEVRIAPLPLATALQTLDLAGVAAVFAIDPDAASPDAPEVLAALYGLTPAECALATLLSRDLTLSDAADQLCITLETARSHLKALLRKTGTNRQASLVRLLVRGPASLAIPRNRP